jgi:hypothetical protein
MPEFQQSWQGYPEGWKYAQHHTLQQEHSGVVTGHSGQTQKSVTTGRNERSR